MLVDQFHVIPQKKYSYGQQEWPIQQATFLAVGLAMGLGDNIEVYQSQSSWGYLIIPRAE